MTRRFACAAWFRSSPKIRKTPPRFSPTTWTTRNGWAESWWGSATTRRGSSTTKATWTSLSPQLLPARVTIDQKQWGVTPVKIALPAGRHVLELEIPGVARTTTLVDLQSRGEIHLTLTPPSPQTAKDFKDTSKKITILLSSFQNMGSQDSENYRSVFPQVIGADIQGDPRIVLVDAPDIIDRPGGVPGAPDFARARQGGIDLIVSGYYAARPDGLLVYAALYDVGTELPRASVMYTGTAGLSMFDSIDSMASEFLSGIDRALPGVRTKTAPTAGVESRIVSYEKKRADSAIIARRQAMRSSLSFVVGPSIAAVGSIYQPAFPGALLAFLPLGVIYDYSLGGPISLTAILRPAVAFGPGTNSDTSYASVPYLDIPLRFGPSYTVFGSKVDLAFGFLGEGRFVRAWFDNGSGSKVYKSLWVFGLDLETSLRVYLQSRISDRPSWFLFGFEWYIIGMETEIDLSQPRVAPLEISLALGYGFRL